MIALLWCCSTIVQFDRIWYDVVPNLSYHQVLPYIMVRLHQIATMFPKLALQLVRLHRFRSRADRAEIGHHSSCTHVPDPLTKVVRAIFQTSVIDEVIVVEIGLLVKKAEGR